MNNQSNRNGNGPRQNQNNQPSSQRRAPQSNRNNNPNSGSNYNDNRSNGDNRNRPYRPSNRYRRPNNRTLNSSQILQKYDSLLELHLKDRRRYFEYYNRVDYYQRDKLERQFYASIEHLRKFENSLEDWQKDYLKKKTEKYRLDLTYSKNHELPPIPEKVDSQGNFEDPHFTKAQMKAYEEYKNDVEESLGSYDDYLKYKNLN